MLTKGFRRPDVKLNPSVRYMFRNENEWLKKEYGFFVWLERSTLEIWVRLCDGNLWKFTYRYTTGTLAKVSAEKWSITFNREGGLTYWSANGRWLISERTFLNTLSKAEVSHYLRWFS